MSERPAHTARPYRLGSSERRPRSSRGLQLPNGKLASRRDSAWGTGFAIVVDRSSFSLVMSLLGNAKQLATVAKGIDEL
jgi:hypothetical protein